MIWIQTGVVLILQIYFWGAGLILLLLPRRLLRFWPAFCPAAGIGLQSALVWAGAHTVMPGTQSYAGYALALPIALLACALVRLGPRPALKLFLVVRRWGALWVIMAFCFVLQVQPLTKPPVLTSISLGSCDAADYAAGARVLQEFSSRDRSGFVGLTEVVQVFSVDNFFDYTLRLHHFTPCALLALNGALLGRQPHELASLLGVVLAVSALPVVFWLARAGFRLGPLSSSVVTLAYGMSPVVLYAIYHTALGQLAAIPAVALLTWAGVCVYRGPGTLRHFFRYAGLLLLCNWMILGAYNFFIVFSYAALFAYVGWRTFWERHWARAARWVAFMGINLALCIVLFPGRVVSLRERFLLLDKEEFGWRIAAFRPEGWFGAFANSKLEPANALLPQLFGAACLLALGYAVFRLWRSPRRQVLLLAAACTVPIFFGYGLLVWIGQKPGENASYDAYKLFAVFYPGILISLCLWLGLPCRAWSTARTRLGLAVVLGTALLGVNFAMAQEFRRSLRHSALRVDRPLVDLAAIEQWPAVNSVNVCLEGYWPRLWANYFLLRKPQYFPMRTYEARAVTPLRGDWDLRDTFLMVEPSQKRDAVEINDWYYLIDRRGETFLEVRLHSGWHPPERNRWEAWCWAAGSPQIAVTNPHDAPLAAELEFSARSLNPRDLQVRAGDDLVWVGKLGSSLQNAQGIAVRFPPGRSLLHFDTSESAVSSGPDESRALTFALYRLRVRVASPPPTQASGEPP